MTVWAWVIVGVAAFLVVSMAIGLACAAILGQIGVEVSELFESDLSASAPLTRESASFEDDVSVEEQETSASAEHLTGHRSRR
jgi:hypothetical protein